MPRTLDHSPAKIVRKLLVDMGIGVEPAYVNNAYVGQPWPAFFSSEPPAPDDVLVVNDTAGEQDGRTMDGELQEHFGFQVRVRSVDHDAGWLKAFNLRASLAESVNLANVVIGSKHYLVQSVTGIGDVMSMGKEVPTSRRSLFTVNALLSVRQR